MVHTFKTIMVKEFRMSDLGDMQYFISMQVQQ